MKKAKDYIIFPLDVPTIDDAKRFVELLAGDVGLFKVGLELFIRSGSDILEFIHSISGARVFLEFLLLRWKLPQIFYRKSQNVSRTRLQQTQGLVGTLHGKA